MVLTKKLIIYRNCFRRRNFLPTWRCSWCNSEKFSKDIQLILDEFNVEKRTRIFYKGETKTAFDWLESRNIKGLSKHTLDAISPVLGIEILLEKADLLDVLNLKTKKFRR